RVSTRAVVTRSYRWLLYLLGSYGADVGSGDDGPGGHTYDITRPFVINTTSRIASPRRWNVSPSYHISRPSCVCDSSLCHDSQGSHQCGSRAGPRPGQRVRTGQWEP